jgi:hypothetical protein
METVSATSEFSGDIREMADRCRSLQSRECWPGAVPGMSVGTRIIYGVSMRLQAATMTDIEIDEHVNESEELDDGSLRIRTTQRVTWPDGHEDAMTEYLFIPGTPNNTLQFTYAYDTPGKKLVKPKERPKFRHAMERVAQRYVANLTKTSDLKAQTPASSS